MIGALALHRGEADALICGLEGRFASSLRHIKDIVGLAPGAKDFAALSLVIARNGAYFLADTHAAEPTAEEIADLAFACAHHVRRFGVTPKIALISHSDFGSADTPSARQDARAPWRSCTGAATRISRSTAKCRPTRRCRWSRGRGSLADCQPVSGEANVLIFPNLDAGADRAATDPRDRRRAARSARSSSVPPSPRTLLTPSVTARGIVNMTAIAAAEAAGAE